MTGTSDSPLVSVIVPAYNAAAYLREALESVFAQDWRPFEVIVVDDASEDETPAIARSFDGVRYIRQEHGGAAAARNTALEVSEGAFVANFDADDLLPPNRLSVQARYLIEHPNVGCVLGRQEWMNPPEWFTRDPVYGDLDGIPLSSAMFRREVLHDLGGQRVEAALREVRQGGRWRPGDDRQGAVPRRRLLTPPLRARSQNAPRPRSSCPKPRSIRK